MDRFGVRTLIMTLAGMVWMATSATAADSIFPDKNLEAAVRKLVFAKKNNAEPLTKADVEKISTITARGKKIANLSGLEHCEALASLDLAENDVVDLMPLKGLKNLQSLTLSKNKIKDITPLSGLTKLQYVELSSNQVADVAPLGKLANLRSLYLSKNQIADISALGGLSHLWSLYLEGNKVTSIDVLGKLKKLSSLDLKNNGIANIAPLGGLTELRYLFLDGNKVTDIGPLVAMAKADAAKEKRFAPFWRVYLDSNPLSEAAKTKQLAELKTYGSRVKFEKATPAVAAASADAQKKAVQAASPGPYHGHLKPLVGDWSAVVTIWPAPGAEPIKSKGEALKKWILGDRFVEESFRGEAGGQSFRGMGLLGYDNVKKVYAWTWVDSMSTGITMSTGTCDESGKVITVAGETSNPVTGKIIKQKIVLRIINNDKHVLEMFEAGAKGKDRKILEVAYSRWK